MNARDVRTGVIREVKKDGASEKGCEPILNKKMKSTKVQTLGTVMRHAFRYANGSHGSVNRLCMASLRKIVTANRRQRIRNIEVQNSWWIHTVDEKGHPLPASTLTLNFPFQTSHFQVSSLISPCEVAPNN